MYTTCPACNTCFRVSAPQLAQAHGQVRCGQCKTAFNALAALTDQPHATSPVLERTAPLAPNLAVVTPVAEHDFPAITTAPDDTAHDEHETPLIAPRREEPSDTAPIPEFVPPTAPPWFNLGTLGWTVANLTLIALLAVQYLYFARADLARYPELRPTLDSLCNTAGCDIPLLRDVKKIQALGSQMVSHPTQTDALLVSTTLINNAASVQPYPVLQLNLADVKGKVVALRRFQPGEYLDLGVDIKKGMPPRTPVSVTLEIVEPDKSAVSFVFEPQ